MKIRQEFTVSSSPQSVWQFFQDVPAVAQCLPGAELTGTSESGEYEGLISVKLGPMTAAFEGAATVTADAANRRAEISGKGVDKKGGSRGQVKVVYEVAAADPGSKVLVDADITLSGPAAQFGRTGLINEMSKRLISDFVACLEAKLAAGSVEEASEITSGEVSGIKLFFSSLISWLKRIFGGAGR